MDRRGTVVLGCDLWLELCLTRKIESELCNLCAFPPNPHPRFPSYTLFRCPETHSRWVYFYFKMMPPDSDAFGPPMLGITNTRKRWLVFTKHRMRNARGETANHNSEVPNYEHYSRSFPLTGRQDMIDLANLFSQTDYMPAGHLPATGILREFFQPNAIRPTLMTFPQRNGPNGAITAWSDNARALEFYAVLKARDVKNTALIQDPMDWRATTRGPEYVSVSLTVPMQTEDDMVRFVQTLTGGALLDFMHSKCRVHLTNCEEPNPDNLRSWQDYLALTEDAASEAGGEDSEQDEDASPEVEEPDTDAGAVVNFAGVPVIIAASGDDDDDNDNPFAIPDTPEGDFEYEDSSPAHNDSSEEPEGLLEVEEDSEPIPLPVAAPVHPGDREVITLLSEALFEHRESMSEGMFLTMSNSLKRTYDKL